MTNDPLARLAAVNPVPDNMPPLAVDVEQIKHAGQARPRKPSVSPHPLPRRLIIGVPMLALICAAALSAALGFHNGAQRSATQPTIPGPRPEFARLTRVLEVFNSPSVAYQSACRGARPLAVCTLRTESSQVRSVAAGGGYTAVIEPTDVTRTTPLARRGQAIVLALHGPTRGPIQFSAPTPLQAIRQHGLLVSIFTRLGRNRGAILVPNNVARVAIYHLRIRSARGTGSTITISTSKVAHNISILRLTGVSGRRLDPQPNALKRYFISSTGRLCHAALAVYALPATAQMAWMDASGKLIRETPISLRIDVGITNPPQNTVSQGRRCA